jgi:methylated-DNA-[protein]-cysteine S-methyltransferase
MEVFDMTEKHTAFYHSQIGWIKITGSEEGIFSLEFIDDEEDLVQNQPHPSLQECIRQLDEYFRGQRQTFSLKLFPEGTDFQKRVWNELLKVPFGKTAAYSDIAASLGDKNAVRAVGSANGKNPISIIVPCHRIIGRDGNLIGYGGGLWRKEWLLKHEGSIII